MKTIKIYLASLIAIMCLQSCDSNKGKIKEMTKQFVSALNEKDKATIYNMFPDAKNISNMKLPENIIDGEISVEKNDSGLYIASISNSRQQKFVFDVKGDNEIQIKDSYSLFELDSAAMELSIKTGVPLKKISDINISELMNEEGKYILHLMNLYSNEISGNLVYETGEYSWNHAYSGNVTVSQPIRNKGDVAIKGSEYNVEFTFYSPGGTVSSRKKMVESGVDLEPNEAATLCLMPGGAWVYACDNGDFAWYVSFVYKNMTPIKTLLKYVKFSGNEYDKYVEGHAKVEEVSGLTDLYTNALKRKLTEDDLKDLSKEDLRKLRNVIYAAHGYIFKDKELTEFFSSFDWYKGTTSDMNKIANEFNEAEKYNVKFIAEYEKRPK